MDFEEVALFIVVLLPLTSLCFGLTLRLAIKPFVETLANVVQQNKQVDPAQAAQLNAIRHQLHDLTEALAAMQERVDFDRQLVSGSAPAEGD